MEPVQRIMAGRRVVVYPCAAADAPTVYVPMYRESGQEVRKACAALGSAPFHLVTLSDLRWEADLSPWPCPPVFAKGGAFAGEAAAFTEFLTAQVLPFAEGALGGSSRRVLAGYSMAGLYALYAPFLTDAFSCLVCASGSVWYPDFVPYVEEHRYRQTPEVIYLSLGDRESRTKNPLLRKVRNDMERLCCYFERQGIPTIWESNPGNHYTDTEERLARGIVRVLEETKKSDEQEK